ncbi:hypothetical protein ISF_09066 [Cordyceps fumosorosea ARSEF 2679]|uniref:Uncharacterized protein n=1 Tax=Cordyceps fumosorosea (strain ARSEF 2679) TaxID=1081104 RepID=A0A167LHY8_CORFA|nr:hypothetical protein ISF_09066 [Cordyceps fumosorosea ARSEF 2679]OAA53112.1 hypothetical protein ISF_09066 [Cordyceps fumosorosea ARSEF 2679]
MGCLTTVRLDGEDLRVTVAVQPEPALFHTLVQAVQEPTLRMITVITPVDGDDDYAATAKQRGAKFAGDGGKIMTARLSCDASEKVGPEDKLAAVDPALVALVEVRNGCCTVQVMAGDKWRRRARPRSKTAWRLLTASSRSRTSSAVAWRRARWRFSGSWDELRSTT